MSQCDLEVGGAPKASAFGKQERDEGSLKGGPRKNSSFQKLLSTFTFHNGLKCTRKLAQTWTHRHKLMPHNSHMLTVHTSLCLSSHQVHAAHKRTNIRRKGLLSCKWHYTARPQLSQCASKTHTRTAFRSQQIRMKSQQYLKFMCDQRNLCCNPSGPNGSTRSFSCIRHQ